jgi:hypothetical protein
MSQRLLLLITVLPLVPITVLAGEMPKEGTDSFTNTWLVNNLKDHEGWGSNDRNL